MAATIRHWHISTAIWSLPSLSQLLGRPLIPERCPKHSAQSRGVTEAQRFERMIVEAARFRVQAASTTFPSRILSSSCCGRWGESITPASSVRSATKDYGVAAYVRRSCKNCAKLVSVPKPTLHGNTLMDNQPTSALLGPAIAATGVVRSSSATPFWNWRLTMEVTLTGALPTLIRVRMVRTWMTPFRGPAQVLLSTPR